MLGWVVHPYIWQENRVHVCTCRKDNNELCFITWLTWPLLICCQFRLYPSFVYLRWFSCMVTYSDTVMMMFYCVKFYLSRRYVSILSIHKSANIVVKGYTVNSPCCHSLSVVYHLFNFACIRFDSLVAASLITHSLFTSMMLSCARLHSLYVRQSGYKCLSWMRGCLLHA